MIRSKDYFCTKPFAVATSLDPLKNPAKFLNCGHAPLSEEESFLGV
jgi:hypothetical protein